MNKSNRLAVPLICAALMSVFPVTTLADGAVDYGAIAETADNLQSQAPCSYGRKINEKGLRSVANLLLSFPELPKGVINVTNDSNIFFGLTGGFLKGVINTSGRLAAGVVDLVTLPIPTKPIAYPLYAWEDFDQDTRYESLFRSDKCPNVDSVVAKPEPTPAKPAAVVTPPRPVIDNTSGYPDQNNQKIDTLFQQRMMK
jgi:putative exosortase-associated protein (TIGR04073 family)